MALPTISASNSSLTKYLICFLKINVKRMEMKHHIVATNIELKISNSFSKSSLTICSNPKAKIK